MAIMGGEGTWIEVSDALMAFQSAFSQLGVGAGGRSEGVERSMVMGTWSDPVEGRVASQPWKKGNAAGLAKETSRTPGQEEESNGNRVKIPGTLRREYPRSAALSKYGAETEISWEESSRRGSGRG